MNEEQINTFKLNLLDLPHDKVYVEIKENYKKYILRCIERQFGLRPGLYKRLGVSQASFYKWKTKSEFPLFILIELLKILNLDTKDIQENLIKIRSGVYPPRGKGSGNLSKYICPKFPIEMSKELARILAHIFGDGCLSISRKKYINLQYYNQNKELLNNFRRDIISLFNANHIYEGTNKKTSFLRFSSSIGLIFNQIVNSFNSKDSRIPDIIKKADNEYKIEFIKSFFDDEAHVKYKPPERNIELALSNKKFLMDMKILLKSFDIDTTKIYASRQRGFRRYTVYIRNYHNLKKYYQYIGFNHKRKQDMLKRIILNPGQKHYSHGETERKILELLKKKALTSKELSLILNRSVCTIHIVLKRMKEKGSIKHIKFKKKYKVWVSD